MAIKFVESGEFLWNSGMFIWSSNSIINAFTKLSPDLHKLFDESSSKFNTEEEMRTVDTIYPLCKNISIDNAIMEKADNVLVVPSVLVGATWVLGVLSMKIWRKTPTIMLLLVKVILYNASKNIVRVSENKRGY